MLKVPDNVFGRHALEVKLQAPGQYRYRQLLRVCGCQQELHMLRRLFQGFQKGVKRLVGEHVHLINEVHLVAAAGGRILNVVSKFPHIINTRAGGSIDFNQINKPAFLYFTATGAFAAGFCGNTGFTVQAPGQQAANGGFTDPTGAGKQIGMVQTLVLQRMNQRLENVFLAHHILKGMGPPFSGKYLVAHDSPNAEKNAYNLSMDAWW